MPRKKNNKLENNLQSKEDHVKPYEENTLNNNNKKPEVNFDLYFCEWRIEEEKKSIIVASILLNGIEIWSNNIKVDMEDTPHLLEYEALLMGLIRVELLNIPNINIKHENTTIIQQLKGEQKIDSPKLLQCYQKIKNITDKIYKVTYYNIPINELTFSEKILVMMELNETIEKMYGPILQLNT